VHKTRARRQLLQGRPGPASPSLPPHPSNPRPATPNRNPKTPAPQAGKDICLANKETLIAGGPTVLPLAAEYGVKILPADSEHSAIFQVMQGLPEGGLRRCVWGGAAGGGACRGGGAAGGACRGVHSAIRCVWGRGCKGSGWEASEVRRRRWGGRGVRKAGGWLKQGRSVSDGGLFSSLNTTRLPTRPPPPRIILTASGGAFRDWPVEKLSDVTVDQAITHPNWSMGKKITIDSATLMNKVRGRGVGVVACVS
jgi:hypothetical protein